MNIREEEEGDWWSIEYSANSPVERKHASRPWCPEGGDWSNARAVICAKLDRLEGHGSVWSVCAEEDKRTEGMGQGLEEAATIMLLARSKCVSFGSAGEVNRPEDGIMSNPSREQRPTTCVSASFPRDSLMYAHTCSPVRANAKHPLPIPHVLPLPLRSPG